MTAGLLKEPVRTVDTLAANLRLPMTPLLPGPRSRATVAVVVLAALLGAGFFALRSDHDDIKRHLGVPTQTVSDAADPLAGDRREIRESLVRTAIVIAGHAQDWHLRPAAFGGGDGRWTGLTFEKIGFMPDPDRRYRTTDGAFTLRPEAVGLAIEAANDRLGVEVVVEVRGAARGGGLGLFVDGQPLDGAPPPTSRRLAAPELAHRELQREAEQLADFVTMVLQSEPPDSDVQRARATRRLTLADLGVQTERDGTFATPYGALRLSWLSPRRGRITGTNVHGSRISVDVHVSDPLPAVGPPPGPDGSGVVPERIPPHLAPLPPGERVERRTAPPR